MSEDNTPELSMGYLLGKIEQIANDTAYLQEAIAALKDLKSDPAFADNPQGDNAGEEKAKALGSAIMCRETTNQQLIALYRQMYEDIRGPINDYKTGQLRQILETFSEADTENLPSMEKVALRMLGLPTD